MPSTQSHNGETSESICLVKNYKNKSTSCTFRYFKQALDIFHSQLFSQIPTGHTRLLYKCEKRTEWVLPQKQATVITESVKHYLLVHIWWYNYTPGHTLSQPAASSGLRTLRGHARRMREARLKPERGNERGDKEIQYHSSILLSLCKQNRTGRGEKNWKRKLQSTPHPAGVRAFVYRFEAKYRVSITTKSPNLDL